MRPQLNRLSVIFYEITLLSDSHLNDFYVTPVLWAVSDQVKAVAPADALLGLHGNGLTHVSWLAASRSGQEFLCEVFTNLALLLTLT